MTIKDFFDIADPSLFLSGIILLVGFLFGMIATTWSKFDMIDLIKGDDGKIAYTKFWANIALAVGIWAFCFSVYTNKANEFLWLIFLGVYTGNRLISNLLMFKYASNNQTESEKSETKADEKDLEEKENGTTFTR